MPKSKSFCFTIILETRLIYRATSKQAIACFEAAKCIQPQDQAVDIHPERAHNYQQRPPQSLGMVFGQCLLSSHWALGIGHW